MLGPHGARQARRDGITGSDVVLDVEHIARWPPRVGPHLTLVRIER